MTFYQCTECGHIRPADRVYMRCPACRDEVYYEALDQPSYKCTPIDVDKIRALVGNLVLAGALQHACNQGRTR